MNFSHITDVNAIRVSVNGNAVTPRKRYVEIALEGQTPESYVRETLQNLGINRCVVEVFRPNGNSFVKKGQFDYFLNSQSRHQGDIPQVGITLSAGVAGVQISLNGHQIEIQLTLQNKQDR